MDYVTEAKNYMVETYSVNTNDYRTTINSEPFEGFTRTVVFEHKRSLRRFAVNFFEGDDGITEIVEEYLKVYDPRVK